jgi:hypothetical protein
MGWVNWPSEEGPYRRSNGGMSVYACWTSFTEPSENVMSPNGEGVTIHLLEGQLFSGASGPNAEKYTLDSWRHPRDPGFFPDAVVLLGTSRSAWFDDEAGEYFKATLDSLDKSGRSMLGLLSGAYGFEPDLLTFLDT